MLNIRDLLFARREGSAIQFGVKDLHNAVILLGTSLRATPRSGPTEEHKNITLYPEQGRGGIIAVSIVLHPPTLEKRQDAERIPALLKITWDECNNRHSLDLSKVWMPAKRRGFASEHGISVTLDDGSKYATANAGLYGKEADADLLCKYLAGDVSDAELRHSVRRTTIGVAGVVAALILGAAAVDIMTTPKEKDEPGNDGTKQ